MKQCDDISALSREADINRRLLYRWRDQYDPPDKSEWPPPQNSRESTLRKEVSQLKRVLAEKTTIQQIVLEHRRRYGYRRVTAELRRRGLLVNHKRVARLMREDNLLAVQPRAFVVTTDSRHEFEVYLNLASHLKLTGINQLWVADITYIRLQSEFVYLAVILDGFL